MYSYSAGPRGEKEQSTLRNVSLLVLVFGPRTTHALTCISHCVFWWRRSCWLATRRAHCRSARRGVLFSYMILRNLLDLCLYELSFVYGVRQGAAYSQCFQGTSKL